MVDMEEGAAMVGVEEVMVEAMEVAVEVMVEAMEEVMAVINTKANLY